MVFREPKPGDVGEEQSAESRLVEVQQALQKASEGGIMRKLPNWLKRHRDFRNR